MLMTIITLAFIISDSMYHTISRIMLQWHRKHFMINLHKSMGPSLDQTNDPWISAMGPSLQLVCGGINPEPSFMSNIVSGFAQACKCLNLGSFLEKSLKIKSAFKSTGKSLKSLEKSLNSTIFFRT